MYIVWHAVDSKRMGKLPLFRGERVTCAGGSRGDPTSLWSLHWEGPASRDWCERLGLRDLEPVSSLTCHELAV